MKPDARDWTPFDWAVARELAFENWLGSTLVVGDPTGPYLEGLRAHAAAIGVLGDSSACSRVRRRLGALRAGPVARVTESALAEVRFTNVIVLDLAGPDVVDRAETVLAAVADGGRVLVRAAGSPADRTRLRRLLAASCGGTVVELPSEDRGDEPMLGTRHTMEARHSELDASGALPITVVIHSRNEPGAAEELLADVLRRQTFVPSEVFVLDDARDGETPLPTNLFGLADGVPTRVALFPTKGRGADAAMQDALGGVSNPFVAFFSGSVRIAPNHLVLAGLALERAPKALASLASGWVGPAPLAGPPGTDCPLPFATFRTAAIRRIGGFSRSRGGRTPTGWRRLLDPERTTVTGALTVAVDP